MAEPYSDAELARWRANDAAGVGVYRITPEHDRWLATVDARDETIRVLREALIERRR